MLCVELKEINWKETKKSMKPSYKLVPLEKQYKDYVVLTIKGDIAKDVVEGLKLPEKVGDTVTLDFGKLNKQGKLPSSEKGKGE